MFIDIEPTFMIIIYARYTVENKIHVYYYMLQAVLFQIRPYSELKASL